MTSDSGHVHPPILLKPSQTAKACAVAFQRGEDSVDFFSSSNWARMKSPKVGNVESLVVTLAPFIISPR